jgi:multiple sugar transport system substrate-binding protein
LPAKTISADVGHPIFSAGGRQVAVPYNLDFRGTAFNMTMLRKAGITSPPGTWQELTAAAQALKARGVVHYPVALPLSVTEGSATPWYALTRAAGGQVLDSAQKPAFARGGKQALTFIKNLYDSKLIVPGSVNLTDEDISSQFTSGQAAILLSASPGILSSAKSGDKSTVKSDDLLFTAVPGATGAASALIGLQEGLGIPANSKHREAAAQFLYWWQQTGQQVTSYIAPDMGNVPSQSAALARLVSKRQLLGGQQILQLSAKVGPVFAGAAPTWYSQFSTDVASMLQSVAEGHATVDAAISKLTSQANALRASGK